MGGGGGLAALGAGTASGAFTGASASRDFGRGAFAGPFDDDRPFNALTRSITVKFFSLQNSRLV